MKRQFWLTKSFDMLTWLGLLSAIENFKANLLFTHRLNQLISKQQLIKWQLQNKFDFSVGWWKSIKINDKFFLKIYLDSNATAYAEFFEWKEYFKVSFDYNRPFCHLCEALNRPQEYPPKIAENLHQWWRTDANCKAGNDLPLLNAD